MTRRYLNPAWKNRSTEELERALERAEGKSYKDRVSAELAVLLRRELEFRKAGES